MAKVNDEKLEFIKKEFDKLNNNFNLISTQLANLKDEVDLNDKKDLFELNELQNILYGNLEKLKFDFKELKENFEISLNEFDLILDKKFENLELNSEINRVVLRENLHQAKLIGTSRKICCMIKDVKKFIENNKYFSSKPIEFLNIKWSILIEPICIDDERYLSFYLQPNNEIDDTNNVNWECKTYFKLILKNLNNRLIKNMNFTNTFTESLAYGCERFISEDELFDNIIDDTIKMEIYLKVDEIKRNI